MDWWTLGILIFEMLASYTPFYHEDHMKMCVLDCAVIAFVQQRIHNRVSTGTSGSRAARSNSRRTSAMSVPRSQSSVLNAVRVLQEAKSLVRGLLEVQPTRRLGVIQGGAALIKRCAASLVDLLD